MTPQQQHLVIFAKAPRMGCVKSRLAVDVGRVRAWGLYRAWLTALIRRMRRDSRWTTWLAITPDSNVLAATWGLPKHRRRGQGRGDLGARMNRAMASCPPGNVILIGADIPMVRGNHIADAFKLLRHNDAVFGPTPDGGFWLVGAHQNRPISYEGVRWSSPDTLEVTIANNPHRRIKKAATLHDIDTATDLAFIKRKVFSKYAK